MKQELSTHFKVREFCRSQVAARMGMVITPSLADIRYMEQLCVTVLEPLRNYYHKPILITSGLRPVWLNKAIGGAENSAHIEGRAADILVEGYTPLEVCKTVEMLNLPVDQCIQEFPPDGWTHVAIAATHAQPRRQYLTARSMFGRTVYTPGLIGVV